MQKPKYSSEEEQQLMTQLWSPQIANDPENFVMFAFPWGQKNTPLHEASVVGDTVGDPFKDTSSVSLNPVIKFTTLFGLLAVEIAVTMQSAGLKIGLACIFFIIALIFVYRSFYGMRITGEKI